MHTFFFAEYTFLFSEFFAMPMNSAGGAFINTWYVLQRIEGYYCLVLKQNKIYQMYLNHSKLKCRIPFSEV